MAYLLTQILICLALAALVGGVAGWLTNGYRAAHREQKIKTELMRQSLALNQAETDNKMIEDDYRDLKYRSEESIGLLKEEIRQLPALQQNLEKSQTLLGQLLQKHAGEKRHIQAENDLLAKKIRELENRENAVKKLQMELNAERLENKADKEESNSSIDLTVDLSESNGSSAPPEDADASQQFITNPRPEQSAAIAAVPDRNDLFAENVRETEFAVTDTPDQNKIKPPEIEHEASPSITTEQTDEQAILQPGNSEPTDNNLEFDTRSDKLIVDQFAADNENELPPDFGIASHTDDLSKIFGIGPVTIKTLNALGIENYQQIAGLNRSDIEYIAEELQIFPGRIERDNWVGSAKKILLEKQATMAEDTEQLEGA